MVLADRDALKRELALLSTYAHIEALVQKARISILAERMLKEMAEDA